MSIVVPAILEREKGKFFEKIQTLKNFSELKSVQVDFADGIFVSNSTILVDEIDALNPAFFWEAHLMVKSPKNFLDYKLSGFHMVIVHCEAFESSDELKEALLAINALGLKAGLAFNPESDLSKSELFKDLISQVLIMGVEPGFQGRKFLSQTTERLEFVRKLLPRVTIEIDGGVNFDNLRLLQDLGADKLAVGSALFGSINPSEMFRKFSEEVSGK